jgi:hypothetical protein
VEIYPISVFYGLEGSYYGLQPLRFWPGASQIKRIDGTRAAAKDFVFLDSLQAFLELVHLQVEFA